MGNPSFDYTKKIAVKEMQADREKPRGWPRYCTEDRGLPRVTVLAKLPRDEREMVIAYHRIMISMELSDLDHGHDGRYLGWTLSDHRKSAVGRLKHLEVVAKVFNEIDQDLGFIPYDPMRQAA